MKAYAIGSRAVAIGPVIGLLVCMLLTSAQPAHAIVISRGIQDLNVSYEDCLARAYHAFVAEGYNSTPSRGEGFVSGFKGNHGSYINCTGIPGRGMSVIIFVASEGVNDPNVPGAERVRLQQRMAGTTPPPVTPPSPPTPPTPPPGSLSAHWHTGGNAHHNAPDGQRFTYSCPGGGTDVRAVWGFDVYTYDSGICLAGVQAGVITRERGGPVTIEMRPGQSSYSTGSRNGVTSLGYGQYTKSFVVVGAVGAGYRAPSPPPPVSNVPPPTPPPAVLTGRVWHEVEETEHAVWTRRPGTNIFDASWSNGRVRAVLEMSFWGNQVTLRRTQGTDGYECTYTGTVEGNLASGTFGCNRFSGQKSWRATIDPAGGTAPVLPTAPTGPPAQQARYLGCFKDPNNPFDLDGRVERSGQNTPQRCIQSCAAQGFRYAGVQYGQSCLCGNSYGRFGPADNCNMRCTGDGNQICGGFNANSVYSTGH